MRHKNKQRRRWPALCGGLLALALLGQGALPVLASEEEAPQVAWEEPVEGEEPFALPEDEPMEEEPLVDGQAPVEAPLPEPIPEDEVDQLPDEEQESVEPEQGLWPVASEEDLLAALPELAAGDTLLLQGSFGLAQTVVLPALLSLDIRADENGPYTIFTAGKARHFLLEGMRGTTLTFENITLTSQDGMGGGMELVDCHDVAVVGAHITGTTADMGGALLLQGTSALLDSCVLENNTARLGGAVYLGEASGLRLESTTLAGNTAAENGGAVALDAHEAFSTDVATQFSGNRAVEGYELADAGLITLHDALIETNTFTGAYQYAYNNHDVSYAPEGGEKVVPGSFGGESRRRQREEEAHALLGDGYGNWQGFAALPGAGNGVLFSTTAPTSIFGEEEPVVEWSLLNVILGCAGFTISVLTLLGLVACRAGSNGKKPQPFREMFRQDRLGFSWGIVGALAGFALLLAMVATQNVAGVMVLADGHTLLFSTGVALQLTCVALLRLGALQADTPGRYWAGRLQDIEDFSWE